MLTGNDLFRRMHIRNDFVQNLAVTTASAYTSGNALGGLITIADTALVRGPIDDPDLSAILQSLVVADLDNQKSAIDLYFFNQAPSAPTDKTAYAPTTADLKNCIGMVPIVTGDYVSISGMAIANAANQVNLGRVLKPLGGKSLYCVPVVLGTPTWTNGIQIRFQFSHGH